MLPRGVQGGLPLLLLLLLPHKAAEAVWSCAEGVRSHAVALGRRGWEVALAGGGVRGQPWPPLDVCAAHWALARAGLRFKRQVRLQKDNPKVVACSAWHGLWLPAECSLASSKHNHACNP